MKMQQTVERPDLDDEDDENAGMLLDEEYRKVNQMT